MLDLKFIRENPDFVKAGIANKNEIIDIDHLLKLDEDRREVIRQVEQLKADRNQVSSDIARKKKAGENADKEIEAMRMTGEKISELDTSLRDIEDKIHEINIWIPNIPHDSVPLGGEDNIEIIKEWGEIKKPKFNVLPHWEIGEKLDILDLQTSAKISGSGFYILKGLGSKLQRALVSYMLDIHTSDGFKEFSTPYLVNENCMFGTGQIPKMAEDVYRTENDNMYLIPTAEVSITNIYREAIVDYKKLPIYMVGYSPCFRREAGAAGKETRGMIRVHQFDKVEMVKIVHPDNSYIELELLLQQAEKILQGLKIPYRVGNLASGDLSFAAAKCYDIELWAHGVEKYLEISSCSNFEAFQARRMNCRFRDEDKKVKFVHTLNGSGLALARLIAAILENYQNEDMSISIPEVLVPYMGGLRKIA